ncbi:MAG TPA: hypothetical protein VMP01_07980 [Pirellulaceae bacterium]|nr:hypothetical protein [Pirellulaceae bacterium]
MLYPHVARLFGTGEGVLIPSPDYALTPTTLAVTGGVLLAIAFGPFVLGPGQSLWRKAHFPLSDRQLMWHRLGLLAIIAALCTACFTPVYVGIITFEKLSIGQVAGIVVCVVLQSAHCLAIVVAFAPRIRPFTLTQIGFLFAGIVCMIAGLSANGLCDLLWRYWHPLAAVALATPVGWANAAIVYGVIGGHWWGWLFLLPLPSAGIAALAWLRRGYAIGELRIRGDGVQPIYAFGLKNSCIEAEEPPSRSAAPRNEDGCVASTERVTSLARKRILAGEALAPLDWSRLGVIERVVGQFLTDRQRAIFEHMYFRCPFWTRAWLIAFVIGLPLLGFLFLARIAGSEPGKPEWIVTGALWLIALPIAEAVALLWSVSTPFATHVDPHYPIGLKEVVGAMQRMYWLRLPFWMPMFLVVTIVLSVGRSEWYWHVLVNLLSLILLSRTWLLMAARTLPAGSSGSFSWQEVGLVLFPFLLLALSLPLAFYHHWAISLALLAALVVVGELAGRYYDWLYVHGNLDLKLCHWRRDGRTSNAVVDL